MSHTRFANRAATALRPITLTPHAAKYAEGSCLVTFGETRVLCTASVEEKVPPFLKHSGLGWVTAEYGMLPRATHERTEREASKGKQSGRTQEIQRLIGRSLRTILDRAALGERQIKLDCDVLQADGGTRTAAITGSYVALTLACRWLMNQKKISTMPLLTSVAAVSCGIIRGTPMLDLDYAEDSSAETDANFVITGKGGLVEVQATAEQTPLQPSELTELLTLAQAGCAELAALQAKVLANC